MLCNIKIYPYHISLVFNLSDNYSCRTATMYMWISIQTTISIHDEKYSDSNGCSVLNLRYNDLPYLMINNVTADIAMSTNNASIVYCTINNVLSEVFVSAYTNDYLPYVRLFGRQQVQMSESSQNTLQRTTVMICVIIMLFISGEFPTTLALAFRTYCENIDNSFVLWLGFSDNGIIVVKAMVYVSYFLNIWVYVLKSKSFRERRLTMLCIASAR